MVRENVAWRVVAIAEQSLLIDVEPGAEGGARPERSVDKTVRSCDEDQAMRLAADLRDWLPVYHRARWVDDLVEHGLDLTVFYDDYTEVLGAPPYVPRLILKLLIFGYSNGITSSRELELSPQTRQIRLTTCNLLAGP